MKIALIPARGGSKRIPDKNLRDFAGQPMIAWSIRAALDSRLFERVVVSTDSPAIARIAIEWGAEVPFMRPPELAGDHVGTMEVIQHALAWLRAQQLPIGQLCCLYATAPFVRAEDLRRGLQALLGAGDAAYAFSVTSFPAPIQRALRVTDAQRLQPIWPDNIFKRSQDLEEAYHDAGQFYWGQAEAFARGERLFSEASVPVILPRHRVHDIDTPEDWRRAELMFQALQAGGEWDP